MVKDRNRNNLIESDIPRSYYMPVMFYMQDEARIDDGKPLSQREN